MKKQILLWFGLLYFFVLQFFVIGYIWSLGNFYILGSINLIVALFGTIVHIVLTRKKTDSENKNKMLCKIVRKGFLSFCHRYAFVLSLFLLLITVIDKVFFAYIPFDVLWFVGIFVFFGLFSFRKLFQRKIYFAKKLFLPKDFLYLLSTISVLVVFWLLDIESIMLSVHLFLAVLVGFLFFVLSIWVFKAIGAYSIWKLISTRFYLVVLLGSFLFILPQRYFGINSSQMIQGNTQFFQFTWDEIVENYEKVKDRFYEKETLEPLFYEGTGKVLSIGSELEDVNFYTGVGEVLITSGSDIVSGNLVGTGIELINSGVIITGNVDEIIIEESDDYFPELGDHDSLTYGNAIKYLMDINEIILSKKTSISFTNVSKTNDLYPYFVTAAEYTLIGRNQKVSLNVKCDNYLVMKGIIGAWNVSNYQGDIFVKYYNAAKDLGELNGCELGDFVVKGNL